MNRFDHQWQRLTTLARQAPTDHAMAVPAGFATRVAARAATNLGARPWALLERLALRGLVAASVCCVAALAFNYFGVSPDLTEENDLDETMSVLLDIS